MGTENKIAKIMFGIFGAAGIVFIIIAIIIGITLGSKQKTMVLTDAVITQIIREKHGDDISHYVYINYQYDGELYEDRQLNYYTSSMYEGKYIEIYVNPDNPNEIMGKNEVTVLVVVFGAIGGVFAFIGTAGVVAVILKRKMYKRLFREGRRIYGTIERIDHDINVSINKRHPYFAMVVVKDDYTGEEKYYRSNDFWDDVASTINIGDTAVIYVDQNNDKKYFVDVTGANSVMGSSMAELY